MTMLPLLPGPPMMCAGYDPASSEPDHIVLMVRDYTRDTFRLRLLDPASLHTYWAGARSFVGGAGDRALPPVGRGAKRRLVERLQRALRNRNLRPQVLVPRPIRRHGPWWRW